MKLQPFRAQKLAEQARAWSFAGLEASLSDLLALDMRSKGISFDGSTAHVSDAIDALAVQAWLACHASRPERREWPARRAPTR